jgi:hypothetical protein
VCDPSIVDHDVNTTKVFPDPQESGQNVLLLGDVTLHWVKLARQVLQAVTCFLHKWLSSVLNNGFELGEWR